MYARKHPQVRRASRFVGLAMIIGTMALAAPIGTSPAAATPAHAWTAYVTGGSNGVTPIDTANGLRGTAISVPRGAGDIAITPDGATAYVTNTLSNAVTPIDTATSTAGTPITVGVGGEPQNIAVTPNGATVYVAGDSNSVIPIDAATNTAGSPIPVAADPISIAITPNGATAYVLSAGGPATITPIDTATNTVGTPISIPKGAAGMAIAPNGATLYVTNEFYNSVTPIDTATNSVGTPIGVGNMPAAIAITPNGTTLYVTDEGSNSVTPIDTATNSVGTPIGVGNQPGDIAITPNGATAYVTTESNTVIPIDTATNTAGITINVPSGTDDIAITPDQAPVAHLSVAPAEVGQPTGFNASSSTVAFGTITAYAWDFGDSSTATTSGPTTTHTYATPGPYTASVTETDSAGTSTTQIFTGQTMSNNGGPSAVASQSFTVPAVSTSVLVPSNGASLSGTAATLDASASNATSVKFLLFGGIYGYAAPVICTTTPTYYGWLCSWNTTTVPDGSYALVSEASGPGGSAYSSSGVSITVDNPPPTTSVLVPSNGASLSGTAATLDASASNATSVKFLLFGGIYGYAASVICTTTPTYYGWLCSWNTTTVPDGSYALVSEASGPGGSAYSSSGVSITVDN